MKRQRLSVVILVGILGLGVAIVRSTQYAARATSPATSKAAYYCPMHPTYTSDHPGDCPICNMKLVKRESQQVNAQHAAHSTQHTAEKSSQDICYLHNCPMMKPGQPCPMLVVAKAGEKVTCPICGSHVVEAASTASAKRILYWTDPMLPGYKSDKPGKSPMGMDLVPVYEESHVENAATPDGYAAVLVTPQKQQLIGIKTAAVQRRLLTNTIRAVGTVAHDPELYQAQAEYIQATQTLERAKQSGNAEVMEQAQQLAESAHVRLRHLGISEELIREMATWTEPEHALLYAHAGEPVWVYAQVYEGDLPAVRVGQEVTVTAPAPPGRVFHGAVRAIDAMVDAMTRTTRVRAQLQDPQGLLKPDMYVNVELASELGDVLAIPEGAVFNTGTRQIAFVDKGQGLFEPRDITVGAKSGGFYELKRGVSEGESVVTSGNFLIDSESRLKAALEGMSGGEQPQGP